MPTFHDRVMASVIAGALCAGMASPSAVQAASEFKLTSSASPQGSVEIVQLSGSVDIEGWDRPEIEVTGTPGDLSRRVRLSRSGDQTQIHVEPFSLEEGSSHKEDPEEEEESERHEDSGGRIHLVVHVPAKSSVSTSLVSANLTVNGLAGDVNLRTIKGSVSGSVDGNLRVNTVTGTVHMAARSAKRIEVRTISGNVQLTGGSGEAEVTTVSGTVQADLGSLTRGRFQSISGDVTANYSVAPDAQIEGESMSGAIRFGFASAPDAELDVQSLSGTIDNCFGPKPTQPEYGPGSKLMFKSGGGRGRVRIATKSGDVKLCTGTLHASR